jgi:hypothetical protein
VHHLEKWWTFECRHGKGRGVKGLSLLLEFPPNTKYSLQRVHSTVWLLVCGS